MQSRADAASTATDGAGAAGAEATEAESSEAGAEAEDAEATEKNDGTGGAGRRKATAGDRTQKEAGRSRAGARTAAVRTSGARKDDDDEDEDGAAGDGAAQTSAAARRRGVLPRRLVLPVVLAVTTVILGGLAAWFGTEASSLTSDSAASNTALTDAATTSQVQGQVTRAVSQLFSYNYANPGPTNQAAGRLLTGAAVRQYGTLFAQWRKDAPGDKLTLTTSATSVGVETLSGDRARLLVFATETEHGVSGGQPQDIPALFSVTAVRAGGTWKLSGIDIY